MNIEKIEKIIEKFSKSILLSIKEKYKIFKFRSLSIETAININVKKNIIFLFAEIFLLSSTKPIKKNDKDIVIKLIISVFVPKSKSKLLSFIK